MRVTAMRMTIEGGKKSDGTATALKNRTESDRSESNRTATLRIRRLAEGADARRLVARRRP